MRLQLSFVSLLLVTSLSSGIIWRNFESAREGDPGARAVVLALAPLAFTGMLLLSRIMIKVKATKRGPAR